MFGRGDALGVDVLCLKRADKGGKLADTIGRPAEPAAVPVTSSGTGSLLVRARILIRREIWSRVGQEDAGVGGGRIAPKTPGVSPGLMHLWARICFNQLLRKHANWESLLLLLSPGKHRLDRDAQYSRNRFGLLWRSIEGRK